MTNVFAALAAVAAVSFGAFSIRYLWNEFDQRNAYEGAGTGFFRDLVLATLCTGGLVILAFWFADVSNFDAPEKRGMSEYVDGTRTLLVAILAFLITYGLSAAVIRGIFPERGTRRNQIVSEATALVLSVILAITVATNKELNNSLTTLIEKRGAAAVYGFLVIVFGAIGAFLVWKRITATVRPTGRDRNRNRQNSDLA